MIGSWKTAAFLVSLLLAISATATAGEQELLDQASALRLDYQVLEPQVDACTDGTCAEAQELADTLDALAAERAALEAERAQTTGCGCLELDAVLDDIRQLDDVLQVIIGNWDDIA
jgi:hypothetical protein